MKVDTQLLYQSIQECVTGIQAMPRIESLILYSDQGIMSIPQQPIIILKKKQKLGCSKIRERE